MQLFELFAKFTVDKQDFVKDMAEAEKTGQTTATKLSSSFEKLKKVLIGVVSVAAAKKAASAMMNVVAAAASVGDKIDKQSQALGMSRKAYQEWEYILGQSGASIDSLGVSMKTLNETILGGSDDASKALKEIGLSADGLAQLSQEDAFGQVVRALQALPAGARKSSLAVKLLGKNGQELLPLLNTSVEGVDALREEAERLGLYMSDEGVDAAVAYGDALDAMKRTFVGIKNTVATRVMPTMTNVFKIISDYAGNFHKNLKTAIETGDWAGLFSNIWTDVTAAAGDLWIRISDTVPQLWESLQQKASESESPVLQATAELMGTISSVITDITSEQGTLHAIFADIKEYTDSIKATALESIKSALEWIANPANKELVTGSIKAIIAAFTVSKLTKFASKLGSIVSLLGKLSSFKIAGLGLGTITATFVVGASTFGVLEEAWNDWKENHRFLTIDLDFLWPKEDRIDQNAKSIGERIKEGVGGWLEQNGKLWDTYVKAIDTNIVKPVEQGFSSAYASVQRKWGELKSWFSRKVIEPIKKTWDDIKEKVDEVITSVETAWEAVVTWFQDSIIKPITEAWESFKSSFLGWNPPSKSATLYVQEVYTNGSITPSSGKEIGDGSNKPEVPQLDYDYITWLAEHGQDPAAQFNAAGQDYVPYDDYLTRLHRGEMVLNKSRADDYREGNTSGISTREIVAAISAAVRDGLAQAEIVMDKRTVGAILTPEISRNVTNGMTARRFATT